VKEGKIDFEYERKDLSLTLGRGFTSHLVVEAGYMFRSYSPRGIDEDHAFAAVLLKERKKYSPFAFMIFRYDTSDSQIHPRRGLRLIVQNDLASAALGNSNASFHRLTLDLRKYLLLFGRSDVFAVRFLVQKIAGDKIPLFEFPILGGGSMLEVMRGFPKNRFLDKGKLLANAEYRFPIWRKLGGNVFVDAGCVWPSWGKVDLGKGAVDAGAGLRYFLENFLIRMDIGFSREGTGLYFEFNHVF
jgi:outer membrane protein assembly factor BamA